MTTKTEERLKLMLEEYLELKQMKQNQQVMEHIYSIFIWGVIFGTLISYMSIFPLLFGCLKLGDQISKKKIFWLNDVFLGFSNQVQSLEIFEI